MKPKEIYQVKKRRGKRRRDQTHEGEPGPCFGRWIDVEHSIHNVHYIPDLISELWCGRRSDADTKERGDDETHRKSDDLWPDGSAGCLGARGEIGRVGDFFISF